MKKILIGLLALGSVSVFASNLGRISTKTESIDILCSFGSQDQCFELQFILKTKSESKLIATLPAAVEGAGRFYDLQPEIIDLPWVFGFGGKILYPVKSDVWDGIALQSQQSSGKQAPAQKTVSKALVTGKNVNVSKRVFDSTVYMLNSLNVADKSIHSGLPQGVKSGFGEVVMQMYLLSF